jgi:regulator of protease activity HflC (stomatin/prohibitin superfamily)
MTPAHRKLIIAAVVVLVAFITFLASFGTIGAGERGIQTRLGRIVGVVNQGPYFKAPFVDDVHIIDVRTRTVSYDDQTMLSAASKDLQDVAIQVAINYHIDPTKVDAIFASYSSTESYERNVIEPIIRETVKSTSAQFTAEELVTKRSEFSDKVNTLLAERFASKDSILERFSVTNFAFSKSFTEAIEAKVTAVQNAEAQKNKLEQVKYEAQQSVEKAKAEAESIRIQAQAVTSQGGADYVKLKWIEAWDGRLPSTSLGEASGFMINLK